MSTAQFGFVEIADDLAQKIDGGMSGADVNTASERWKVGRQLGNRRCGKPIDTWPMDYTQSDGQATQAATDDSQVSATALGYKTAIGTNVDRDGGDTFRSASSYSAS